eukprot:c30975_g1_i1 orf=1-201(-)
MLLHVYLGMQAGAVYAEMILHVFFFWACGVELFLLDLISLGVLLFFGGVYCKVINILLAVIYKRERA